MQHKAVVWLLHKLPRQVACCLRCCIGGGGGVGVGGEKCRS